jgi:hypothetical protein
MAGQLSVAGTRERQLLPHREASTAALLARRTVVAAPLVRLTAGDRNSERNASQGARTRIGGRAGGERNSGRASRPGAGETLTANLRLAV